MQKIINKLLTKWYAGIAMYCSACIRVYACESMHVYSHLVDIYISLYAGMCACMCVYMHEAVCTYLCMYICR